jgi:hypothetical protein
LEHVLSRGSRDPWSNTSRRRQQQPRLETSY